MRKSISFLPILFQSASLFAQGGWTEITDSLNPVNNFSSTIGYYGASWIDVDNDNDIDLFVSPDRLFLNDGHGNFNISPNQIISNPQQTVAGSTWADYDNDGDIDCFLSRNPSTLFKNDGSGVFTSDSTVFTTLHNYPSWACAWGDANNDGLLDLLLTHPRGFLGTPFPSFYFKQNQLHQLEKVTGYFFTDSLAPYTVPYWSDYDLDGDQDLFLASGPGGTAGPDYQYKNMLVETGSDTLIQITNTNFATDLHDGQGYSFIDYDNDQDLDLCLSSWRGSPTILYKNDNGSYDYLPTPFSLTKTTLANVWEDFDNDGDVDLVLAHDQYYVAQYFRNDGNDIFTSVSNAFTNYTGASSVALGDYDNDGDIDLFISRDDTLRGHSLFRNDLVAAGNNWVNISCKGTTTNRSAIGTKVKLRCIINGSVVWQIREISAQNNFQGQSDLRVHFGLGNATLIDSVIINYSGGATDIFTNIEVNKFYFAEEGLPITTSIIDVKKTDVELISIYPNPAGDKLLMHFNSKTFTKANFQILDTNSKIILTQECDVDASLNLSINISNLIPGKYILRAVSGNDVFVKSFLKL